MKRKVFGDSVAGIARNHWIENTIPEPAKHNGRALKEREKQFQQNTKTKHIESIMKTSKRSVKK